MEDTTESSSTNGDGQKDRSTKSHPKRVGKVIIPKEPVKKYRVRVHYLPVTEEQARIKKAIIERMMKKTPLK